VQIIVHEERGLGGVGRGEEYGAKQPAGDNANERKKSS